MNNDRKRHWNGKLDSFLQRTITSEMYERICTWEPCVITYCDEKLVHKYVLLSLNCVYLVDFSLKSFPKVAFSIKDVTSVKKLDDAPEFLNGKEREEAVHVQVHYNKKVVSAEKGGIENWLPSTDLSPKLLAKLKGKISSSKSTTSGESNASHRKSSGTSESEETSPLSSPTSSHAGFSRSQTRTTKSLSPCIVPSGVSSLVVSSKNRNVTFDTMSLKTEDPVLEGSSVFGSHLDSVSTQSLDVIGRTKRSTKKVEFKFADSRRRSRSANALNTAQLQLLSTSQSMDTTKSSSVTSVDSDSSCGSEDLSVPKGKKAILKPSTMDLYILRKETDFFYQMNTTWECWKISATLKDLSPTNATKVHKSREHICQLFYQVKHELLATKKMEALAKLFMELNTACRKHLIIKKLFWDSSELLELCLQQMTTYLHAQTNKEHISDVMEYCIIILELLYHVLQESFMCHRRLEVLFNHRGQLALSLLDMLANSAQITTATADGSDKEELSLSVELSEKVFCVFSELLKAADQLKWYNNIGRHFGLTTLVEFVNTKEIKHKGLIVRQLVHHYSLLLKAPGELLPTGAVVIYHMIHILHNLCLNSSKFVAFFRTELMDEIRYCLRSSMIQQKLPERYPLTSNILVLFKCLQDSLRLHSS